MLSYKRSDRVGELIQQEISKIFLEMRDPKLGFTTVVGVKLTDDLKLAKIYYSVLGDEQVKKDAAEVLSKAKPFIRYTLGQRVNLRSLPVLAFYNDSTAEKANRVFGLLQNIDDEKKETVKTGRIKSKKAKPSKSKKPAKKITMKVPGKRKIRK